MVAADRRRNPGEKDMIVELLTALVVAQDSVRATQSLELGDAYRTAREHSPRIAAARGLADAARARTASATRPPDPQVQLGLMNYTLPGLRPMDVVGMTQLQVMQMLPLAGKLGLAGRVATASADAEAARATDINWVVRSKVAMAFYDLYATEQSLSIDRETLRLLQDILGTVESMYRVGEARQADVLRAQVEIARMAQDTVRMTTMRTVMAARLNALIDRPSDAPTGSPQLPVFPDSLPRLDSLISDAVLNRPMLRAGEREVDAAISQTELTRRDIWPDLTVGFQYARRGSFDSPERMGSLMVGATVPLFAKSRQFRMREEAAAMQQMREADVKAMRAETEGAVAESYATLVRARSLAATYRSTVFPQAEAAATSALASYRSGAVDFMTLLDNRMGLNRYHKEVVELEADEGKAWADLEMLLGRELYKPLSVAGRITAGRN
jgi:outer membrane protein, heavy metal efflux system